MVLSCLELKVLVRTIYSIEELVSTYIVYLIRGQS